MKIYKSKFLGTGMFVPKKVVTNFDLEKIIETSDEWIFERTGIKERRISSSEGGEWPSDMSCFAGRDAIKAAGLSPNDIDLIILATFTPDVKIPNTSTIIQQKLEITNNCACFDLSAACSGFVYGVNMANAMIQTGVIKNALIFGAEMLSREIDWHDRNTSILFGDGAGAAVLGRADDDKSEILSVTLGADGTGRKFFESEKGGAVSPITKEVLDERSQFMKMHGKEMFKVAVRTLADSAVKVLKDADMPLDKLDWLVPHQANIRIIQSTAKRIGIPMDKVIVNIEKYGNTSAGTVPIAFHEAVTDGRIKRGDIVLFDVFGAGLTSGATLLRY